MNVMLTNTRTPSEAQPPRMEPLARLPVFFALEGKRAVVAGGSAGRGLEGGAAVGGGRGGRRLCARSRARNCWRSRPTRRAARSCIHRRAWQADDLAGAAIAVGAFEDDDEAGALRRRRARRRCAGQCHRQADVLRFLLRRHRQPLAAGDRHFDRRRGAGVRPGDPRQARGDDPARLCALGRGGAALARATEGVGPVVRRAAAASGSSSPRMR